MLAAFDGQVHFLDLGPLKDEALVATTVSAALGLVVHHADPTDSIISFLRDRRLPLVLDSCEHVIDPWRGLQRAFASGHPVSAFDPFCDDCGFGFHRLFSFARNSGGASCTISRQKRREALQRYAARQPSSRGRDQSQFGPRLMLGAPFRARATHVVQLGPVAITHVYNQVVNDAGEVGDGLNRLASKTRLCEPARRSPCDRTGADDAFPDHLFSPFGWMWAP
jgi:hypothetical protein